MGSIQKRGENTYLLTVSAGFGLNKKRLRYTKTITATSDRQAKKILNAFEAEVQSSTYIAPDKMSFTAYANYWLENHAKVNLAPKTYQRYKEMLDLRIIPAFSEMKLSQIRVDHLHKFYDNLREDGMRLDKRKGTLSDRTIKHHHRLLTTMLTFALQWQFISDNPARRVIPPKVKKTEARYFGDDDALRLINALNTAPAKYRLMCLLTIYSGLRRGELMGLRWEDIDTENHAITVYQTSQYVRGLGTIIKDPKNKTSERTISIPPFFADMFKLLQWEQTSDKNKLTDENDPAMSRWVETGLVFVRDNGEAMHPDTITKWFVKFIAGFNAAVKKDDDKTPEEKDALYVPNINFHGLRHTNATLLISQNMDIITISKRLGHSNTSTTLNIYGHKIKSLDRTASEKLENLLKKPVDNSKVSTNCQQGVKKASD